MSGIEDSGLSALRQKDSITNESQFWTTKSGTRKVGRATFSSGSLQNQADDWVLTGYRVPGNDSRLSFNRVVPELLVRGPSRQSSTIVCFTSSGGLVVCLSAMFFASSEMCFSPLTACASALCFNGACLARRVSGQRLDTPCSVCGGPR